MQKEGQEMGSALQWCPVTGKGMMGTDRKARSSTWVQGKTTLMDVLGCKMWFGGMHPISHLLEVGQWSSVN